MFDRKEYNKEYYKKHYMENITKLKEYRHKWYLYNRDRILNDRKIYQEKNKGKISKRKKEYHIRNKDKILERVDKWQKNNPKMFRRNLNKYKKTDKGKAACQRAKSKRRAKEKEIINTLTAEEWIDILKKYKFECAYCGKEFTLFDRETRDHVIPISKGGNNIKENIVPACNNCNARKHNKILSKEKM